MTLFFSFDQLYMRWAEITKESKNVIDVGSNRLQAFRGFYLLSIREEETVSF